MHISGDLNIPMMPMGHTDAISGFKLTANGNGPKNIETDDKEAIGELASKFESILWKKFLDEATKPIFESEVTKDSTRSSIYRDMMNHALANSVTEMTQGQQSVSSALAAQLYIDKDRTENPESASHALDGTMPDMN